MAKKRSKSTKKRERRSKPFKEGNVDDIMKEADAAMERVDVEKGLTLYETAAAMLQGKISLNAKGDGAQQQDSIKLANVLAKVGEAKVSMGDPDGAQGHFMNALSLLNSSPWPGNAINLHETRASLFLYLGQLSSEQEALDAYKNGVQELEACVALREKEVGTQSDTVMATNNESENKDENEVSLLDTKKQLCGAFCNLGELYMTDLCYDDNAEIECESYIQSAMKITDPADGQPLVDALQALANLRLSQNRGLEGVEYILKVYDKMKIGCEALAALVGLREVEDKEENDQAVELVEVDAANSLPSFEFRCQNAKILMECASAIAAEEDGNDTEENSQKQKSCILASIQVLGSLMAENDEVIEIWYLLGCAFATLVPPNIEASRQYWERAVEMLLKVKEGIEQEVAEGEFDDDELEGINEQIENITSKLKEIGDESDADDDMDVWGEDDDS